MPRAGGPWHSLGQSRRDGLAGTAEAARVRVDSYTDDDVITYQAPSGFGVTIVIHLPRASGEQPSGPQNNPPESPPPDLLDGPRSATPSPDGRWRAPSPPMARTYSRYPNGRRLSPELGTVGYSPASPPRPIDEESQSTDSTVCSWVCDSGSDNIKRRDSQSSSSEGEHDQ